MLAMADLEVALTVLLAQLGGGLRRVAGRDVAHQRVVGAGLVGDHVRHDAACH